MPKPVGRPVVRLLSKVQTKRGCWLWLGPVNNQGYGTFGSKLAHRLAYEHLVGPIPDGRDLDHLCRTPLCVNPDHLEPVTHRENCLRGVGIPAVNAAKTTCRNGHAYDLENTYWRKNGQRDCRACKATRQRRIEQAKRRAAGIPPRQYRDGRTAV